jgi:hypothetical protein
MCGGSRRTRNPPWRARAGNDGGVEQLIDHAFDATQHYVAAFEVITCTATRHTGFEIQREPLKVLVLRGLEIPTTAAADETCAAQEAGQNDRLEAPRRCRQSRTRRCEIHKRP